MIAEKIGNLEASFHMAIERLHQTTPPDGLKEASKKLASNLLADFLKDVVTPEIPVAVPGEPEAPVADEAEAPVETEALVVGEAPVVGEFEAPVEGEVAE